MIGLPILGWGAVSGFGVGVAALRAGARAGRTAVRPCARYPAWGAPLYAATVPGEDGPDPDADDEARVADRAVRWSVLAAEEALRDAGRPGGRLGLVVGTNLEDRHAPVVDLARRVGDELGVDGPRLVTSVACASSLAALGLARELLDRGDADLVLAGGVDVLTPRLHAGFAALGALSPGPCHPFDERVGTALGEGAGFVLIARRPRPGVAPRAWLRGFGRAGDAWHVTHPAPDGRGVRDALRRAVAEAGETVAYVNAHGTGTEANDVAEARGIAAAVGPATPVSSSKGLLGHAQGAAGILELLTAAGMLDEGLLPPTWGLEVPRRGAPVDPVPAARPGAPAAWATVNSAFGGANVAVVLGPPGGVAPALRPVHLAAIAGLAPGEERFDPRGLDPGPLPGLAHARARRWDVSRADPATIGLLAVVAEVLDRRGLLASRDRRAETGLVVGQPTLDRVTLGELLDSVERGGLGQIHAGAFARALLVAPAGAVSRDLGLRGPLDVVSVGRAGTLLAVAGAVAAVARGEVATVGAGTADDGGWTGALAALVEPGEGPVTVEAVAVEGPGGVDRALARVGGGAVARPAGDHPLADGFALLRGWERAAAGERVVVVGEEPGALSVAIALRGPSR